MTQLECQFSENLSVREVNIKSSPKNNGSSSIDSVPYLEELGINIIERPQPIQFFPNSNELVHGWSSYVQGFSANFVQNIINRYKTDYISPVIFDPFAGSGTALVQAKLNGYKSYGVELNPLLQFIAQNKLNTWDVGPDLLLKISKDLPLDKKTDAPSFLKSKKHFNPGVLVNLEKLKGGIDSFEPSTPQERKIKNL
ncbi:MAG: site-specific DNA-methyltransferase, partial [Calditrichaeota bacterium]|nr:site-specific DNA-methyltransferase [Calditrichota bacterium]